MFLVQWSDYTLLKTMKVKRSNLPESDSLIEFCIISLILYFIVISWGT